MRGAPDFARVQSLGPRFRGDERIEALTLTTLSIRADAGPVDHLRPALDLRRQIFGEIFRGAALGRHDFEPELLKPLADGWIVQRVAHGLVEFAHDRLRRSLGEEESVPHAGFDAGQTLLARGRELRN